MLDVLADARWHHRSELAAAARPLVLPGEAFSLGKTDDPSASDEDAREAGARRILESSLYGLVRRGRVEQNRDRYRRR